MFCFEENKNRYKGASRREIYYVLVFIMYWCSGKANKQEAI